MGPSQYIYHAVLDSVELKEWYCILRCISQRIAVIVQQTLQGFSNTKSGLLPNRVLVTIIVVTRDQMQS